MKKPSSEKPKAPKVPKAPLETGKHAFYVGKFIPPTTRERVSEFLTGESEERLYSKEFYLLMLKEAFERTPEGQRVKVVVIPQLSRYFNGEEDVKNALSSEDQVAFVKKLAKGHFGRDDIDVESAEDQECHQPLFKALQEAVDPDTRKLDIEKVVDGNTDFTLSENPDSLELFRYLYAVANEYEPLLNDSIAAAPEYWQERIEENPNMQYYALAEAAIRIIDALNGIRIQGGADRQWRFDKIIKRIIGGKASNYRKCEQLKPLFKLVKGLNFETAYVETKENPYIAKRKSLIRTSRWVAATVLGGFALGVAFQQGENAERERREKIEAAVDSQLEERLQLQDFYSRGPRFRHPKSSNVPIFKELVEDCLRDLHSRYQINWAQRKKLKPLLQEFLLDRPALDGLRENGYRRFDEVDQFAHRYRVYFQSLGIEVGRPYTQLAEHKEALLQVARSKVDYSLSFEKKDRPTGPLGLGYPEENKSPHPDLQVVGSFISGQPYGNQYDFYYCTKDGGSHLVARDPSKERKKTMVFTSERAREGARQFLYAMERYDALELNSEGSLPHAMKHWKEREDEKNWNSPCHQVNPQESTGLDGAKSYNDFFGRFRYEFIRHSGYDEKQDLLYPCLLAKTPEDTHYTYERAREMIGHYSAMRDKWYDFYSGKYFEAKMPLDTLKIMEESRSMTNLILIWKELMRGQEVPQDIAYIFEAATNYYADKFYEKLGEYDGSYKATKEIAEDFKSLKERFAEAKKYMENYAKSFPPK